MISRVRPEDAGTYVCHAENEYGRTDTPVSLNVGDMVPYFQQDPKSYMVFDGLNDVYLKFDILLSLKPESTEGIYLVSIPSFVSKLSRRLEYGNWIVHLSVHL